MALERSQDDKSTPLEDQHLPTDFRVRAGEDWVAFWRLTSRVDASQMEEGESCDDGAKLPTQVRRQRPGPLMTATFPL